MLCTTQWAKQKVELKEICILPALNFSSGAGIQGGLEIIPSDTDILFSHSRHARSALWLLVSVESYAFCVFFFIHHILFSMPKPGVEKKFHDVYAIASMLIQVYVEMFACIGSPSWHVYKP